SGASAASSGSTLAKASAAALGGEGALALVGAALDGGVSCFFGRAMAARRLPSGAPPRNRETQAGGGRGGRRAPAPPADNVRYARVMATAAPRWFERPLTHRDLDELPEDERARYEVIDG